MRYGLAAAAVVVTTATTIVSSVSTTATTTAAEDEDKDDYPRTVITTKVTHLRKPPFLFSSHTMKINFHLLQKNIRKKYLTFTDFRV